MVALFLWWLLTACCAQAHDSRPLYVEIREIADHTFTVQWKAPVSLPVFALPQVIMPDDCGVADEGSLRQQGDAWLLRSVYRCGGGLSGQKLQLRYPNNNPSLSALFRVSLGNGENHSRIMPPGESAWQVPVAENLWQVSYQYSWLGIEHIFLGIDHLLFVACLMFIARTGRRILITITGFTVAHSLTLVLSTLDVIFLPIAPVEAVIALSIIFLAHEIAVGNRNSWTWRYPVAVSSSFGLLHGFGFASVLGEIGLPQTEKLAALLFFNIGVEIGQIVFVSALAAAAWLTTIIFRQSQTGLLNHWSCNLLASYTIGITASVWLMQRLAGY